tara:strand:+ start:2212 stop:2376 length:165 start_codon:yes stop_codon:yes gene_type:complete
MDYSQHKALQALLFFSLPVIWCVWQLIGLKRTSDAADFPEREKGRWPDASSLRT